MNTENKNNLFNPREIIYIVYNGMATAGIVHNTNLLIDKGYDALDYRFFLLGAHYRSQVMFSWTAMDSAKNSRKAPRSNHCQQRRL